MCKNSESLDYLVTHLNLSITSGETPFFPPGDRKNGDDIGCGSQTYIGSNL